jgi:hypothetical protein
LTGFLGLGLGEPDLTRRATSGAVKAPNLDSPCTVPARPAPLFPQDYAGCLFDPSTMARRMRTFWVTGVKRGQTMSTIVEYVDGKPPKNLYPKRIVSPRRSGPCCFSDMEMVGAPHSEGRWVFQYRRCRRCGFTVRVILRQIPDFSLINEVRKILATSFVRNVPEC